MKKKSQFAINIVIYSIASEFYILTELEIFYAVAFGLSDIIRKIY